MRRVLMLSDLGFHLLTMAESPEYAVTVVWQPTSSIRSLVEGVLSSGTQAKPKEFSTSAFSAPPTNKLHFVPGL